jgi:hypothetical protein
LAASLLSAYHDIAEQLALMVGWRNQQLTSARGWLPDLRILMVGLFVVAMLPLLATPVLPLIDFYNHVARFYVLAHLSAYPVLRTAYQAHWSLLPNMGVDALATPLLYFIPPLLSGKIIAAAILAVLFSGTLNFHRALTGQRSLLIAVLLLPLLYSYVLNWGFANFLFGLGLAFWAAGWWLDHRHRPHFAVPISCVWAAAIFFSHGFAFAMYGILVVSLEVGVFINTTERRLSDFVRSLFLVAVQAVIPVAYFIAWKIGYAAGGVVPALHLAQLPPSIRLSRAMVYHLQTIVRVEESPFIWFDVATLVIQLAAICFLIWRGRMAVARPAWFLIAIVVALAAIPLPTLFGVGYLADRLPLFAALSLLGALSVRAADWTFKSQAANGILIATVVLRLTVIAVSWHGYSQSYQEFRSIAAKIPPGSLTQPVMVGSGRHETNIPRCEMYGPLLVALYGQLSPLFAYEKQQPLRMIGPLNKAVAGFNSSPVMPEEHVDYSRYMVAAASAGFNYLLVCNTQLLARPFPADLSLVTKTEHFALLRAPKLSAIQSHPSK